MRSKAFEDMKHDSRGALTRLRTVLLKQRLLANERMTQSQLNRILRSASKEHLIERTLLADSIWSKHQAMMLKRFQLMLNRIEKRQQKTNDNIKRLNAAVLNDQSTNDLETEYRRRLRFITILHAAISLDLDEMLRQAEDFQARLRQALVGEFPSVRVVGAIEFEFINLDLMRKATFEFEGKHSGERKRSTLFDMLGPQLSKSDFCVLVHFHGVIDLGTDDQERTKQRLDIRLRTFSSCWSKPNQIQIKHFSDKFGATKKTVSRSLQDIARYITKGCNLLHSKHRYFKYKVAFDQADLGTALDAMFIKEGTEDARMMPFEQIVLCTDAMDRLMARRRTRDGYVVTL